MTTRAPIVLIALVLLAVGATPADAAKKPKCLKPYSWVAGTTSLCRGALVYGDYVDDDYGADTGEPGAGNNRVGNLSPGAGDQEYPQGQEATADLIRLTLRISRGKLHVTGLLNALYKPDQTILAVAIDSDANEATGGGKWGRLNVSSRGWERLKPFTRGNVKNNTISGTMNVPDGKVWRVQAVVANAETGNVMNVAFRPNDHPGFGEAPGNVATDTSLGAWFEDDQAEALRSGDVSEFGVKVRAGYMRRGVTRAARFKPGLHERVYTSDYKIAQGEGVNYDGVPGRGDGGGQVTLGFEQRFNFLGRYQPYGIYIPKKPGPHGMQMVFHGSGANLASLIGQPGMQNVIGEGLNRILVVPEGRGTENFGSDIAERDDLDVMADVQRTYGVDREQVFAGGYSQGGYITYRIASLFPDRFAGAIDWVGFTGDGANGGPPGSVHYTAGAIGNVPDFIKNLLHVPTVMLYSGEDELVHAWTGVAIDQSFQGTQNIYRFYEHPVSEHLTFAALDDWRKEAEYSKGRRLVHDPPRVVYTTARFLDAPQYGITHDRAYWLSALRVRGGDKDYGTVDLTSAGCGGALPLVQRSNGAGDDPIPWVSDDQHVAGHADLVAQPKLSGTLTRVASARIDAKRTCLRGKPVTYDITSDGPSTLRFSDGRTLQLGQGRSQGTLAR